MGLLKTAAVISVPVLGILCATALYLLHKKEEDELYEMMEDVKTSRVKHIEMKIAKAVVGVVIGRGGSNIKEIQLKTDTKINFKDQDDDDDFRTCFIRGTAENVSMAESMLHEFIMTQPLIEVREIWVPQRAVGRIIGRGGETIRSIVRASNAKVNCMDNGSSRNVKGKSVENKIVIKGTNEQIRVALSLIEEKVEEEAEIRRKMEFCQSTRSPRNNKLNYASGPTPPPLSLNDNNQPVPETLTATSSDGILEVFVSACHSPTCFWVQVFSPKSPELDRLLDEMTEYYSSEDNRNLHVLKELDVGQIVTAPFSHDNRWYRAEIKSIKAKDSNDNQHQVDVYYVDYGDSEYRTQNEVYQLRTDFLKLPFQAIECCLANVKPSDGGVEWSEDAVDLFEDLCHMAQWKKLKAKVVSCEQLNRGRREGSPVPRVNLYDTANSADVNIAEELIRQGFAIRDDGSTNGSIASSETNTPLHQSRGGANEASTPLLSSATSPEPSFNNEMTS